MLEQLQQIIAQSAQQSVIDNPEVPNSQNEAVMQETGHSIFGSMQQLLQQGGPGALTQLFQGVQAQDSNHPAVQQVTGNVAGGLMNRLGLGQGTASSIAASLVPMVLGKLFHKAKDPNDSSMSIGSILGSLMGGNAANTSNSGGGLLNSVGKKLGLDKNGDGSVDMKDLMGMFGH